MLTTRSTVILKDLVIIDPWPEPQLTARYRAMVDWIISRRDLRQIILASYESGSIDPAFYALMRQNPSVCLYEPQLPLTREVVIMGQEWWRCVHARPLGIHQLISQGHDLRVDLEWVWRRHTDQQWHSPSAASLSRDAYAWQHLGGTEWQLASTDHNRAISRLHIQQQS